MKKKVTKWVSEWVTKLVSERVSDWYDVATNLETTLGRTTFHSIVH